MKTKSVRIKLFALAALVLMFVGSLLAGFGENAGTLAAPAVPRPTADFYVLDQAQVLSSGVEGQILSINQDLYRQTKAQIVVVTLNSSEGRAIEELGLEILRGWGVGDKELNNGVVLLVIPPERKSRIEVGYGLEGALPDGKTGRIQDEYMLPYFQQGNYDQGVLNGFQVLAQEVAKEYQIALNTGNPQPAVRTADQPSQELSPLQISLIVIGLILLFYLDRRFFNGFIFGMLLSSLLRGGFGGGGGGGSSGGGGSGGGGGSNRGW